MPAGDRSGAGAPTGITINEGDALGEKYRGLLLSADAGRNTIFGYMPKQIGSGLDPGKYENFITSLNTDNPLYVWNDSTQNTNSAMWFRPSDVMIGTDGAIYVADWYDPVVGGHQMNDSTGYGRIYRITPKDKTLKAPVLDFKTIEGLINALKNPAINVRGEAFELLKSKGSTVIPELSALLKDNNPYHQAKAIWLLSEAGEPGVKIVTGLLNDSNELIRATALRALRKHKQSLIPKLDEITRDKSAFVRREAAIALREIPYETARPYLNRLTNSYPGNDLWYLSALGNAWGNHKEDAYKEALSIHDAKNAGSENWNEVMSSLAFELHPDLAVNDLTKRAGSVKLSMKQKDQALTALAFINTPQAVRAMIELSNLNNDSIAERARYWVAFRQSNSWNQLIDWSQVKIDTEQERITAAMQVKKNKILDNELSYDEHYWNIKEMAESPVGGRMLLDLLIGNKISNQLLAEAKKLILKNPDPMIRDAAAKHFKLPGTEVKYSVDEILKLKGDAAAGLRTFGLGCSNCHRIKNSGKDIGPELTLIKKKFDRRSLLDAIIHPSAAIVFGYEPWLITTKNGTSYYGFLIADGKETLVIKDISGNKNILKKTDVSLRTRQEKSIMPEPYTFDLTEKDLANLAEYLLTIQ
jgi:putative heme-binding domain-containing protein